jgi:Na+/H+ antiporter NhaD/arsenite permease-like protein
LDFAEFFLWCGPPAFIALIGSYLIILWIYRKEIARHVSLPVFGVQERLPAFNRWQTGKGLIFTCVLIALFFSPLPRELAAVGVAGALLCSRRLKTREILGLVDWHLIMLFCALFVVIQGISQNHYPGMLVNQLHTMGADLHDLLTLTGVSTVLSNLFSNVPATMLLVRFLDAGNPVEWYTLAVSSTFAGNLIIIGSIANLIVIEQASNYGIKISFKEHAAVGIPVTLFSLAVLVIWIYA